MYPKYFGLKEPSFSIAPDPHYLFLSEQHKEALAHLLYGAGESGGFVLLTGEVGTGKTTVCRAFLEQLPEGVDVALILNPAQSANELLTNICEEFRISLPKGKLSSKMLVDRLNAYLLTAHANGRRPVLIIDEAQNLQPQSMEQIRLLTNLETTKHKLLQIFLIGQPELRRMLERERLRQLDQRITARFHLKPFTLRETGDYIRHRVAVAGVDRPLFSAGAVRRIYTYSGGIPRLINILCDRALLGVCVTRGSQVTPSIVASAAREVRGEPLEGRPRTRRRLVLVGLLSCCLGAVLALAAGTRMGLEQPPFIREMLAGKLPGWIGSPWPTTDEDAGRRSSETAPEIETDAVAAKPAPESGVVAQVEQSAPGSSGEEVSKSQLEPVLEPVPAALEDARLQDLAMPQSQAMRLLLRRWGMDLTTLGAGDPCERILALGLACAQEQGRFSHVRFFDLPAMLQVKGANGELGYLPLATLGAAEATLELPEGLRRVSIEALESLWTGDYTLVWKLPPGGAKVLGKGSFGSDVLWLREQLAKIPGLPALPRDSLSFDAELAEALRAFQASKGLLPDGIAGPRTLIAIQHALAMPDVPRLTADGGAVGPLKDAP